MGFIAGIPSLTPCRLLRGKGPLIYPLQLFLHRELWFYLLVSLLPLLFGDIWIRSCVRRMSVHCKEWTKNDMKKVNCNQNEPMWKTRVKPRSQKLRTREFLCRKRLNKLLFVWVVYKCFFLRKVVRQKCANVTSLCIKSENVGCGLLREAFGIIIK